MNEQRERMKAKKWGVMVHFLEPIQNNPEMPHSEGKGKLSWDEAVNSVDVEEIARQLHELGAGWLLFTLMQGVKYMVSPNETYNKITGYQTGEACSTRDLPMDLYYALKKYDIDLYLYYTGDGPHKDEQGGTAMGLTNIVPWETNVSETFVENWASVLKEYAERYKGKVKAWWIDGCYRYFGYDEKKLSVYQKVLKEADENFLICYNEGSAVEDVLKATEEGDTSVRGWRYDASQDISRRTEVQLRYRCSYEDYFSGEMLDFTIVPTGNEGDYQWHALSPLSGDGWEDCGWAQEGVKYTEEYFAKYLEEVWSKGGVVTVDMAMTRSGKFFDKQFEFMKKVLKK